MVSVFLGFTLQRAFVRRFAPILKEAHVQWCVGYVLHRALVDTVVNFRKFETMVLLPHVTC